MRFQSMSASCLTYASFFLCLLSSRAPGAPVDTPRPVPSSSISFVNDVVPALTRAGCNQGACHGAATGKNGFKLSLRGYAPELDYLAIARQAGGRRVCMVQPERSLLLRKPLLETPHRGGRVLRPDTPEYRILLTWLKQGAPAPNPRDPRLTAIQVLPASQTMQPNTRFALHVMARFSDGSLRDVTHWARFGTNDENVAAVLPSGQARTVGEGETAITVAYQDRVAFARVSVPYANVVSPAEYRRLPRSSYIDDLVYAKLSALRLWPSPPASDIQFARRVTLDLTGTLADPDALRAFARDADPRKRARLIDALMAGPEFVDYWTYIWCDLLRVNRGALKDKGMWAFYDWVHQSVQNNRPWDEMTREILTSTGNTFIDGPANYFRTSQSPEEMTENVSQGFLGIRVQCARCHNHPLEHWTQNDYYGMANVFARVGRKVDNNPWVNDEMTVYNQRSGDVMQPRLHRPIPPAPLGGPVLALDSPRDRRDFFAEWLTRSDNWYFSHAIVNRVWAHFMGRGLVEAVDDLRETNPPTNPALFDALASDFVHHGFDLRHLIRQIVLTRVYAASSSPDPRNRQDDRYYSHYLIRRLTAEQILDALGAATGQREAFADMPSDYHALQLPDTHVRSDFLDSFGRPARQITCECERSQELGMSQALLFINGDTVNRKVSADDGLVDRLVKSNQDDAAVLDGLYWHALGRPPTRAERSADLQTLHHALSPAAKGASPPDLNAARRHAFEDMLWVLVNSKEFLFNH